MKKQLLYRAAAATVLSLSLTTGIVAADNNTSTIKGTGTGSYNHSQTTANTLRFIKNTNDLGVANVNLQAAASGKASVSHVRSGGNATSGNASNASTTSTAVSVSSPSSVAAASAAAAPVNNDDTISNTGRWSVNTVSSTTNDATVVSNQNEVGVVNLNGQLATSGSATVSHDRTGGNATSGNVSNTSTTTTTVSVSN